MIVLLMSQIQIKELGQYFTPDNIVKHMVSMIQHKKNSSVLEPSAGKGIFLNELQSNNFFNICAVEIDNTLDNESNMDITYTDFLTWNPKKKFDVIIGNPPYIRWKNISPDQREKLRHNNNCNGLNDVLHAFISHSINLLNENGELIFITPDYWLKTR